MTEVFQNIQQKHMRKHEGNTKSRQMTKKPTNDEAKTTYLCDICGSNFTSQAWLDTHRKNHYGERNFKCTECEKTFACKQYLTDHLKRHFEQIQFYCEICSKGFKRKRNLQVSTYIFLLFVHKVIENSILTIEYFMQFSGIREFTQAKDLSNVAFVIRIFFLNETMFFI